MNKIVFSVCYIGVLLFLSSCANFTEDGSDKTMGFEKIKKLSGQEISINEILNIENFYISHNYVLIQRTDWKFFSIASEYPSNSSKLVENTTNQQVTTILLEQLPKDMIQTHFVQHLS